MATLKEEAQGYKPQHTMNIADLDIVPIEAEVYEETGVDNEGKEFTYKCLEINGEKYRVPQSVLNNLKAILEDKPDLKEFKVRKTGSGMETRYTVIPL